MVFRASGFESFEKVGADNLNSICFCTEGGMRVDFRSNQTDIFHVCKEYCLYETRSGSDFKDEHAWFCFFKGCIGK